MQLYIVVKTARGDVTDFPGYFGPDSRKLTICFVDSNTGESITSDRSRAEDTVKVQTEEYGEYFDYMVYELEISVPVVRAALR